MVTVLNLQKKTWRKRASHAFSLVEVTLALGIISVSIISLIGLMPTGLNSLRDSMDQTVHAQIVQRISGDLAASDFSNLTNQTIWFDGDGRYLGSNPEKPSAAFFSVTLTESAPSLPGLTNSSDLEEFATHLKRVQIGIKRTNLTNPTTMWYAVQIAAR